MAALRDQWLIGRKQRQQEVEQRRQAVQANLIQQQQDRQQIAAKLRQELTQNYESIQAETHLYLTQVQQQRQVQARHTAAKLQEFDAELKEAVADMRAENQRQMQEVQKYVADLQAVTHQTLAGHTRDRAVMRSRQTQQLRQSVDELQDAVAEYLDKVAEIRHAVAVQDRAQRHRDREALEDEVQALRDDFSVYREQMRAFRENLRQAVWGDTSPNVAPVAPPPVASKNGRKPQAIARPIAPTPVAPVAKAVPVAKTAPVAKVEDAAPGAQPSTVLELPTEEAVYDYLQQHSEGARLTEIESTLGINRFQAVDALRSLIQKELIVQKDRIYHIQEEAVL